MGNEAKIITVAGKGGVGKTSICASIVRLLAERYPDKKILAIDADPAVGLSVALGVDVKLTLDDIRMSIVDSVEKHGKHLNCSVRRGSGFLMRWSNCRDLPFLPSAGLRVPDAIAKSTPI